MKHKSFLLLMVALLTTIATHAYDFQSGDLYYDITSDTTVKVTYQENYSSNNYKGLTTATIPETVTNNGTTYSVTSIGNSAFYYCYSLTSITIGNSVTTIEDYVFRDCPSLTSITIGNSVMSIGDYVFWGCSALTSIVIPNSVTSIGEWAFWKCSALTSITIGNSVTSIGWSAFYECSSLTFITIQNSVMNIEGYAFFMCSSLTSITIPNSVTSIGCSAFLLCTSLTSLTCLATTPPACGSDCFSGVPRTIPLYVPAESVEAYKAADTWKEFQVQALPPSYSPVDLVSITVDGEEIADFDPKVLTYDIALPEGTTTIPTIDATAYNEEAQVLLIQATTLPGQASAVVITTDSTQTYTIYFSKKSTPTDISDRPDTTGTDSDKRAEKFLRNGQVLIIRNGKTYSIMGQQL
ncbi:MAG: leucine-rich repeat domain-containing protein [Bacteroidales bacterium]|nr:leucine-rich repeat domain-containing protein [Bacteroidales bacterium]